MPRLLTLPLSGPPDSRVIGEAASVLRAGGLVILPTDTVYGIAADPRRPEAEARLYAAKGRPMGKPVPLLVAGVEQVDAWPADFSRAGRALAARYWPGALTLVLKAGMRWEGFRVPDHPATLALLRAAGGALRVTSANRSGCPPARTAADAAASLGEAADLVLDAGPAPGGMPSTVVKAGPDGCAILRAGAIPAAAIWAAAGRALNPEPGTPSGHP